MKETACKLSSPHPAAVYLTALTAVTSRAVASPPGFVDMFADDIGVEVVAILLVAAALCVAGLVFRAGTRLLRRLDEKDTEDRKD